MSALTLSVGDPPEAWAELGFVVDSGCCRVGDVCFALGAEGRGVRAWSFGAVDGVRVIDPVDAALTEHPNGAVALDHLVMTSPSLDRTLAALGSAGLELRRVRETDTYGTPMRQAFFKIDSVVLEVIGPDEPSGDGPARLWGLAFTSGDLDATAAYLGDRLHPPKDAVQPGRRIATLDKSADSTVPIAFMSR